MQIFFVTCSSVQFVKERKIMKSRRMIDSNMKSIYGRSLRGTRVGTLGMEIVSALKKQ